MAWQLKLDANDLALCLVRPKYIRVVVDDKLGSSAQAASTGTSQANFGTYNSFHMYCSFRKSAGGSICSRVGLATLSLKIVKFSTEAYRRNL
eukprot:1161312-Pelagomonas_calceolata.AAC.4